jgi:hypothetical protein
MQLKMNRNARIPLGLLFLPALLLACTLVRLSTSTSTPAATPTPALPVLTVSGILQDYTAYKDQLVSVQGYGIMEMTMPLCPGHVGMDKRMVFVDKQGNSLTAVLEGDLWEKAVRGEALRDFLGYVRLFSGDIGCPGSLANSTFPYFEIVEVR